MDFNGIWAGFGEGLGGLVGNFSRLFYDFLVTFSDLVKKSKFWSIWEVFRESFGRVWGRFWDGLGRVWEPFGRCWALPGLLYAVFRFCFFYIFGVVVALSDASAASVARLQDGCLLFFERAKRASEALWCFLWVSMAHCACTALLLSGTFLCLLLLLWVLLLLLVLLPLVGNFGALQLHASTTFKTFRASRSLIETGYFWGSWSLFFSSLFSTSFFWSKCIRFWWVLGGFGNPKWRQNRRKIEWKSRSKQVSIFTSFFVDVERFEPLKMLILPR